MRAFNIGILRSDLGEVVLAFPLIILRAVPQGFLILGTLFLLPIIVMYTGWSYYVFRGKVRGDAGYH